MNIIIRHPNGTTRHPKVVADVEVAFSEGVLEGMTLKGIAIWKTDRGLSVTLPSRKHGDQEYDLLRAIDGSGAIVTQFKTQVLDAYAAQTPSESAAN